MKKINALLGLLLTGLALSACDKKGDNVKGDDKGANNTAENGGSYGDNGGNSGNANGYKYDANKAAWSDAEKNIFATFLHNADVPYKNIDQETELVFDEDYSRAIKTAPVCSDAILAQYGALFDDTWSNYSYFNDDEYG